MGCAAPTSTEDVGIRPEPARSWDRDRAWRGSLTWRYGVQSVLGRLIAGNREEGGRCGGERYGNPGELLRQVTLRNVDVKVYFGTVTETAYLVT